AASNSPKLRRRRPKMARQFLIIDGYNLLHACDLSSVHISLQHLERARNWFIRFLANRLAADERQCTTIVFDAADAPPGLPREQTHRGLTIRFAPPGVDADTVIEDFIAHHSAPRQLLLVSSDHRLQKAVRRRRGDFIDSEDFIKQMDRR